MAEILLIGPSTETDDTYLTFTVTKEKLTRCKNPKHSRASTLHTKGSNILLKCILIHKQPPKTLTLMYYFTFSMHPRHTKMCAQTIIIIISYAHTQLWLWKLVGCGSDCFHVKCSYY